MLLHLGQCDEGGVLGIGRGCGANGRGCGAIGRGYGAIGRGCRAIGRGYWVAHPSSE